MESLEHTGQTEFDRKQTVHTNQQAARISALEAERDSHRRRSEHFQRAAYALETTLQACAQRLNCDTGPVVVAELATLRARCERAEAVVRNIEDELAAYYWHGSRDCECQEDSEERLAERLANRRLAATEGGAK